MSHSAAAAGYAEVVEENGTVVPCRLQFPAMKMKPEVRDEGVCREIWYALGVADAIHKITFGKEAVVTSLTDGAHNPGSLHPKGYAADLRTHDLTTAQAYDFFARLRKLLAGSGYDVLWEGGVGATPATTGAHVHVEYDPKAGEEFCSRLV